MTYLMPTLLITALLGLGACTGPMGPQGNTGNTGNTGSGTVIVVPAKP